MHLLLLSLFFFFNDTATTEIYTLSLHDALPICYLLFGFFFLASGFDLFGRGAKMPLDFSFFLLRRAFPEDILVLRIRLGKIVETESLREFQVAAAFRIALDHHVNAPFNFRGRTFSATAEVLIVFHLELSNIFFECSQFFVDGGHTRGKTSNHTAKSVE